VRVTLTGRVALHGDDGVIGGSGLGAPAQLACAYLVLERRRPVSRDELAELLWTDDLPQSWKQLVRGVIAQIRVALREAGVSPTEALTTAFSCYQIQLRPGTEVDVEQAADDLNAAHSSLRTGDHEMARRLASEATRVAARGLLPAARGLWIEAQQAHLRDLHLRALEALAEACHAAGDHAAAMDAAESAVALEPYRESAYVLLMRAHAAAGNRAVALHAYERCRDQLREQLGVEPAPSTEAAYVELLRTDSGPAVAHPGVAGSRFIGAPELPASLQALRHGPLVGRDAELASTREFLDSRSPTVGVFIGGEAGIGKSRLGAELAAGVAEDRALVLHGTFDVEGSEPFGLLGDMAAAAVRLLHDNDVAVPAEAALAPLVPTLRRPSEAVPAPAGDPVEVRTALFEAVVALLIEAAAIRPLVLVLDDIQWASVPTVLLLRHIVRGTAGARLTIIATFRDEPAGLSEPIVELLADAARSGAVRRLSLRGLDVGALTELIRLSGDDQLHDQAGALARDLHETTGGNALFAREVIRHWNDGGTGVPPAVADIVRARLLPLSPAARRVVAVGAVVGPTFDVWPLSELTTLGDDAILTALEEAAGAGLVGEVPTALDRWRFAHEVVRDVIAAEVSAGRQARIHTRLGLALAQRADPALAGDVAVHLLAGTPDHRAEAIDWLVAAAQHALDGLGFESAVAYYERAVIESEHEIRAAPGRSFQLRLALAEALRLSGSGTQARTALLAAVDLARQVGDADLLATAAIALATVRTPRSSGRPSSTITALLEEVLQQLPETSSPVRAAVMSHLAIQLQLGNQYARASRLVAEAERIAERLEDPSIDLLTSAVVAGQATDPLDNLARSRRWLDAAIHVGDEDHETWARIMLVWAATASGHLAEARHEALQFEHRARAQQRTSQLWWPTVWEASQAIAEGRFGDADGLIDQARLRGASPEGMSSAVQIWFLRASLERLTGALSKELVAEFEQFRHNLDDASRLAALDVWVRWYGGQRDDVTAQLRSVSPLTLLGEHDGNQLAYAGMLAEVAAAAHPEPKMLDELSAWLRPFAGRYLVLGYCGAVFGSVDRTLALLGTAADRRDRSRADFAAALRSFSGNGAAAWAQLVTDELSALDPS